MTSNENELLKYIRCPITHEKVKINLDSVINERDGFSYPRDSNGGFSFIHKEMFDSPDEYKDALEVIEYWGNGWIKREDEHKRFTDCDREGLVKYAKNVISSSRKRRGIGNIWSTEIDFSDMDNKVGLNIGCGMGGEASYIMSHSNTNIIAIDITKEARDATKGIIDKLGCGLALQADARYLPIESNSMDYVFSSGVLHHSKSIEKSIDEIFRVLKPGGIAYVGLYSNFSYGFLWVKFKGILNGNFSKSTIQDFFNRNTEKSWRTKGLKNPLTTVFGKKQIRNLFNKFSNISIRRGDFYVPNRPILRSLFKPFENTWLLSKLGMSIYTRAKK